MITHEWWSNEWWSHIGTIVTALIFWYVSAQFIGRQVERIVPELQIANRLNRDHTKEITDLLRYIHHLGDKLNDDIVVRFGDKLDDIVQAIQKLDDRGQLSGKLYEINDNLDNYLRPLAGAANSLRIRHAPTDEELMRDRS